MTPAECRISIIRPTLAKMLLWSQAAEDLLLGTAIQESALKYVYQFNGPALGYWQMEPTTHDDIWKNYLLYRSTLAGVIKGFAGTTEKPQASLLASNPAYACAMARICYLRSPMALPAAGDIAGYAHMWKTVYNTRLGAGTEQEFIDHWNAALTTDAANGSVE